MYKTILSYAVLFIILFQSITSCSVFSSGDHNRTGQPESTELTLISWNVHNLFDARKNGFEYPDFDPSRGRWTEDTYREKLKGVARVLHDIHPGGADIIALQEVENKQVLTDLNKKYLAPLGYTHEVLVPSPGSAVNTAFLSRLPITAIHSHRLDLPVDYPLRDILEINLQWGGEKVVIFNNHWKSKRGGAEDTEPVRRETARLLKKRVSWYAAQDVIPTIIIAGDFNENPDENIRINHAYPTALKGIHRVEDIQNDPSALYITFNSAMITGENTQGRLFYSPWEETVVEGSFAYRGQWERIDNIFLSEALFDGSGIEYGSFRVASDIDRRISDHLPILITLGLH